MLIPDPLFVYVGTYSVRRSEGIYVLRFDPVSGTLTPVGGTGSGDLQNPSFLALHPNTRFLYAVSEVDSADGRPEGRVASFAISPQTGTLTPLNHQSSRGTGPCFVAADAKGKNVLVANYGGGTVAVLPIGPDGGLLPATARIQHTGPSKVNAAGRQNAPHAHSIHVDPSGHWAVACDLGLDKILVYRYDAASGTLAPHTPAFVQSKPGAGPRAFSFAPNGHFGYAANELDSTVTAYRWDTKAGTLTPVQTVSSLPPDGGGLRSSGDNSGAEVQVHPNGKWVYASNRGHDSIAVFAVEKGGGGLRQTGVFASGGKTPRHFAIDPTGSFLIAAHQNSDSLVVHRIDDTRTGGLSPTGQRYALPSPVCVVFRA